MNKTFDLLMAEVQEKFPDIVIDHCGAVVKELGYHLHFPNGYTLSIQFGPGSYSENRDAPIIVSRFKSSRHKELNPKPATAEIAMWYGRSGGMMEFPDGDTVHGWTTYDEAMKVIEQIRDWNAAKDGEVDSLPPPQLLLQ